MIKDLSFLVKNQKNEIKEIQEKSQVYINIYEVNIKINIKNIFIIDNKFCNFFFFVSFINVNMYIKEKVSSMEEKVKLLDQVTLDKKKLENELKSKNDNISKLIKDKDQISKEMIEKVKQ